MFLQNCRYKKIIFTTAVFMGSLILRAQDLPATKTVLSGNNLLATLLVITAIVLLMVLWGMGQVLITLSRQLLDKSKKASPTTAVVAVLVLCLLSQNSFAQDTSIGDAVKVFPNYGGLSATTFYFLVAAIATEVTVILFLFFSIRRIYTELNPPKEPVAAKASKQVAFWKKLNSRMTKSIPIEQESGALLDHEYDGIRELDNALPPWWKYGFVVTICFALVYLLNFHVLGNGKNPTEEYAAEMESAKIDKEAYEAINKDKIDESHVPMADATGVKQGQEFFLANCIACHGSKGEGGAGPNLTDNYWLHKGSLNDIYNTIKKGYPDKGMQSWAIKFSPKEISELASFVKTLKGSNPPGAKAPQGDLYTEPGTTDSLKVQTLVNK